MTFVATQTFDFNPRVREELEFIDQMLACDLHPSSRALLIARRDRITEQPVLKVYDPREP